MRPYFKDKEIKTRLEVTCGRCESTFSVILKKRKDHPVLICPKCKVKNRFDIIWK